MTARSREEDILASAVDALKQQTGFSLEVKSHKEIRPNQGFDALLTAPGVPGDIAAEIKDWAPQANLDAVVYQLSRLPMRAMLVANYINPAMAERLKAEDISFIDTAGNAYINVPPVYIFIKGQKAATSALPQRKSRAFESSGLRVVFALLCNPELANASYRQLADITDVAVGTVGWVIGGLKEAGFIVDRGRVKGRHLINRQRLLTRWVEDYPLKLRPKLTIGNFMAKDATWWKDCDLAPWGAKWGGEVAAAKLNNYLVPKVATVYLPQEQQNAFLAKARLRKVEPGVQATALVQIYRPFWQNTLDVNADVQRDLVHPILVYADLIATGDSRNREAADTIYETYLARHIGED